MPTSLSWYLLDPVMHYDNRGGKGIATSTTANEDDGSNPQGSHIYSGQKTRGNNIQQHIMGNGRQTSFANLGVLSGVTLRQLMFISSCATLIRERHKGTTVERTFGRIRLPNKILHSFPEKFLPESKLKQFWHIKRLWKRASVYILEALMNSLIASKHFDNNDIGYVMRRCVALWSTCCGRDRGSISQIMNGTMLQKLFVGT